MRKLRNTAPSFLILVFPMTVFAVPGVADHNTYHHKYYTHNSGCANINGQWDYLFDWIDEMSDITQCHVCKQDTPQLYNYIAGNSRSIGLNADLVAIETHGTPGYLYDVGCVGIPITSVEPLDDEVEIYLIHACEVYSTSAATAWGQLRNAHRFGALVTAGCYGDCTSSTTLTNNTWNEIGDSIADSEQTIYDTWLDAHSVGISNDDIIIYGMGRVGASNCDDRARNVSFQNRLNYHKYSYPHDQPWSTAADAKTVCGYYWSDY